MLDFIAYTILHIVEIVDIAAQSNLQGWGQSQQIPEKVPLILHPNFVVAYSILQQTQNSTVAWSVLNFRLEITLLGGASSHPGRRLFSRLKFRPGPKNPNSAVPERHLVKQKGQNSELAYLAQGNALVVWMLHPGHICFQTFFLR